MNNAIARFGRTCVSMLVGGGIAASALLAGNTALVTVTLPHAVTVGAATLPSGQYTISSVDMASGDDILVIRSEKGNVVATLQAQKTYLNNRAEKSQVVLSRDGDTWNLDKLFVEGDGISYQFVK